MAVWRRQFVFLAARSSARQGVPRNVCHGNRREMCCSRRDPASHSFPPERVEEVSRPLPV